jgi:hypothetical protein
MSFGATIPAGSFLVVRTLQAISSIDAPGTRFPAQLDKDVVVNGKVVLPVGTKVSGRVATSKRTHTSSQRLTDVEVGGRSLLIKNCRCHWPGEHRASKTTWYFCLNLLVSGSSGEKDRISIGSATQSMNRAGRLKRSRGHSLIGAGQGSWRN